MLQPCPRHPPASWQRFSEESQRTKLSGGAWRKLVRLTLERDGGLCTLGYPGCTVEATTADHIIGRAAGGADSVDNLRASCKSCNEARIAQQSVDGRKRAKNARN